jgi:general stress protein YciG
MSDEHLHTAEPSAPGKVPARKPRGFAAISPERRREISAAGGKAAHAAGAAHQFTTEEAQAAGRKGGLAKHVRRGPGPKPKPQGDE